MLSGFLSQFNTFQPCSSTVLEIWFKTAKGYAVQIFWIVIPTHFRLMAADLRGSEDE